MRIAIALCVVLLGACQSAAPPEQQAQKKESPSARPPVEAKAGGYALTLQDSGTTCVVEASRGDVKTRLDLEFRGPCEFVRDHKGEVMSYRYADAGNVTVVIVVGEIKEKCGPVHRALLLRDSEAKRSVRVARGSLACPASGLDEVEFSLYGHERGA